MSPCPKEIRGFDVFFREVGPVMDIAGDHNQSGNRVVYFRGINHFRQEQKGKERI